MKKQKLPRILLVSTWQSYELVTGIVQYASEAGWHLDMTFFISGELPKGWKGEGALVLLGESLAMTRLVKTLACPIVSMTVNRHALNISYVDSDNERIGALAAEHFLKRNFQHFAYYALRDWPVDRLRGEGFSRQLKQAGHSCEWLTWSACRGRRNNTWENRQQWLKREILRLPKPLAFFTVDDLHAVELIEAGQQLGLRIPEDLAILGVGNHKLLSNTTAVALSSITTDEKIIGYQASRLLDRCMKGEKSIPNKILVSPSGIVERKSTETIATNHPEVSKALRFMMLNYQNPIGIQDIVATTALSQTRLYQAFQSEFGESPARFLNRIRLDRAKQMLIDPANKLATISEACGFGDSINLFRVFKRFENLSPKQYRKTTC